MPSSSEVRVSRVIPLASTICVHGVDGSKYTCHLDVKAVNIVNCTSQRCSIFCGNSQSKLMLILFSNTGPAQPHVQWVTAALSTGYAAAVEPCRWACSFRRFGVVHRSQHTDRVSVSYYCSYVCCIAYETNETTLETRCGKEPVSHPLPEALRNVSVTWTAYFPAND